MQRSDTLDEIKKNIKWDMVVIGGGASGLGIAVDAASRGLKTLLVEQADFAKGTSSKSTKLIHGGVRYLAQGDIALVLEALRERGLLRKNASHLVKNQCFIIPNYSWWGGPFYGIGMKVYDRMAGNLGLGPSVMISKKEALERIPNLSTDGLLGGVIYYDGQFDDARLAINLAETATEQGASVINYMKVKNLLKNSQGIIDKVEIVDQISSESYQVEAKAVINATGVFVDDILQMAEPGAAKMVTPSQGIHLILNKSFLKGSDAIMIPKTSDGRVLFAVPWHSRVILGTTDTPVKKASLEPKALDEEVNFILNTAADYLEKDPSKEDVLSVFAGLRPLAAPKKSGGKTKEISRGHRVIVHDSGLITIVGGKWTTYRKMAEDVVNQAITLSGEEFKKCQSENLKIHGCENEPSSKRYWVYGTDGKYIDELCKDKPDLTEKIHPNLPITKAEVVWCVRNEMVEKLEDVLARRTRALLLDAKASVEACELVAKIIAEEKSKDQSWIKSECESFRTLAKDYSLT